MTASIRKIEANRANARRSTGPRTARGKARSSRNATRHGLGAAVVRLSNAEKCRRWRLLRRWLAARPDPDETERDLLGRIATAQVLLERIRGLVDESCIEAANRDGAAPTAGLTPELMRFELRYGPRWSRELFRCLTELDRHRRRRENAPERPRRGAFEATAVVTEPGQDERLAAGTPDSPGFAAAGPGDDRLATADAPSPQPSPARGEG